MNEPEMKTGRRNFLKGVAAGGAAVAAAAAVDATADIVPEQAKSAAGPRGYRHTQHVDDYYKTARI